MSDRDMYRLLGAHQFIARAFEKARIPDSLLHQAHAALRRAYP